MPKEQTYPTTEVIISCTIHIVENAEVEGPKLRHRVHLNPTRCFTFYGAFKLRPDMATTTTPEISMDVYINKFGKMRIVGTHSSIWSNATQLENPRRANQIKQHNAGGFQCRSLQRSIVGCLL